MDNQKNQENDGFQGDLLPIVEEEKSFLKKFFSTLIMILSLAGLGVLGWFAYEESKSPAEFEKLPLIKADTSPFKVKPKDPGGMEILNKDKAVYDAITSSKKEGEGEGEEKVQVLPPPEEPVNLKELSKAPAPFLAKKEKVEEIQEEKPKEEVKKVELVKEEKELKAKEGGAKLKVIRLSSVPKKPVVTSAAKKIERPQRRIPFKPKYVAPESAKKVVKKEKVKSAGGSYRIQLGSYKTPESLHLGWLLLQKKFPELLGDLRNATEIVELEGKGTFYRLHAGLFDSEDDADNLCKKLIEKNQGCLIAK